MHNIQQLMKQAEVLQKKMTQAQSELALLEIEGSAGGGLVKAVVTGKHEIKSIKIDKTLVNKEEIEMLEDLVVAAVNNAHHNASNKLEDEMRKLNIPPELAKMTI